MGKQFYTLLFRIIRDCYVTVMANNPHTHSMTTLCDCENCRLQDALGKAMTIAEELRNKA